jgi:flagellar motility protein MotE (MotC chaperone)
MADQEFMNEEEIKAEKKSIADEKKKLKDEQAKQKKEAKKRAKEIAKRQAKLDEEDEEGGSVSVFLVTIVIVVIWLAILCLLVKLDVGGFGSGILTPILKDVPVVNKILPSDSVMETSYEDSYEGYTSLRDAVEYSKTLESQLEDSRSTEELQAAEIAELKAEVLRLQEFEDMQVEFQRIKNEFYEEVVYAEKGPGPEEYIKYFESIDPTTAETLYKQAVVKQQVDEELEDYAKAYSEMKPKEAAGIFEKMTNNLELVAKILGLMNADDRGKILGVMEKETAAKITKIMDPEG